jgi:hypothetical protein
MKNFLIIVLALALSGAAAATRPDREDFDRFLTKKQKTEAAISGSLPPIAIFQKSASAASLTGAVAKAAAPSASSVTAVDPKKIEFKDFILWTVVKQDGKTLYTGVFAHWVDNQQVRGMLPS